MASGQELLEGSPRSRAAPRTLRSFLGPAGALAMACPMPLVTPTNLAAANAPLVGVSAQLGKTGTRSTTAAHHRADAASEEENGPMDPTWSRRSEGRWY